MSHKFKWVEREGGAKVLVVKLPPNKDVDSFIERLRRLFVSRRMK